MAPWDGWRRILCLVACICTLIILLVDRYEVMGSTLSSMMISTTNSVEISDEYATRHNKLYKCLKMRIGDRK